MCGWRECLTDRSALLAFLAIGASAPACAETTINVAGDCNFVVVEASLVLSDDFQFSNDCADPKWVREEYTRVFGAAGVPPLMLLQEARGNYEKTEGGVFVVANFRDSAGDAPPLSSDAIDFWNSEWPHQNATALTNMPLWSDYAGNFMLPYWTSLLEASSNKRALTCLLASDPLIGIGHVFELPGFESASFKKVEATDGGDWCQPYWEKNNLTVGFTFLTLENASNKTIDEIDIDYRYYKQTSLAERLDKLYGIKGEDDVSARWPTPESIDATIDNTPDDADLHEFMSEQLGDKDMVEFKSRKAEVQTRRIAALAPGEKVIILLNVYYTDESLNYLPGYYIDGNVFVEKLVFRAGRRTVSRNIRDPFGEQAARKSLSWGWASQ